MIQLHKVQGIEGYKESELKLTMLPEAYKAFQNWACGITVMRIPKTLKNEQQDLLIYYYDFDEWASKYHKKIFNYEK